MDGQIQELKLFEAPRGSRVRVIAGIKVPPGGIPVEPGEVLKYHHPDGMYSYCTNERGTTVHLVSWAHVQVVEPDA